MGKVTTSGGSAGTTHPTRGACNGCFFSPGVFLSGLDYGLVSLRWVGNELVWLFSIPVYSPREKRGKRGSRNRGLGFAIGADYGRFFPQRNRSRGRGLF